MSSMPNARLSSCPRGPCRPVSACLALGAALFCAASASAQLNYVDWSAGLQTPAMEAGDTEIEFGDVNGDGHVDIVSIGDHGSPYINSGQHGVMVWFGDGSGNWSVFQNGNFGYGGVALGDVNNDGLMDVGYGMHHNYSGNDFGDQLIEVALGDGTGHNWTPWDDGLATNGETWGMFGTDFADVDNDGDLDVGSISFGCCAGVHVYLNNGDGTWTQSFGFLGGNANDVFAFGDINGDGLADFATASGYGTAYLGDGAGGFTLDDGNLPSSSYGLRGLSFGDVNDDGAGDLAFVTSSYGLAVWTWVAPGTWQNLSGSLPASGSFDFTAIADMNLDGHGDVVAFASGSPGLLVVYAGDGTGNWQQIASVTTPNSCDTAAFRAGIDADHNGYPDIGFVAEENCQPWVGGVNRLRCFAEDSTPSTTWVYPKYPRGGETFLGGSVRFVDWSAAVVDTSQSSMTIELSLVGPDGPWTVIADGLPDNGRYQWLVPIGLPTSDRCRLRCSLSTAAGDAMAVTPAAFTIVGGPGSVGDVNCDGVLDAFDIDPFVLALTDPAGYPAVYPDCTINNADCNGDGEINAFDIDPFVTLLTGG